jgi:hypothetical protein
MAESAMKQGTRSEKLFLGVDLKVNRYRYRELFLQELVRAAAGVSRSGISVHRIFLPEHSLIIDIQYYTTKPIHLIQTDNLYFATIIPSR